MINAFLNIPISSLLLGLTLDEYRGRPIAILQIAFPTCLLLGIMISGHFLCSNCICAIWVANGMTSIFAIITKGFKEVLTIDKPSSRVSVLRLEQKDV
ncbi:hypothetical protein PJ311_03830 [Bacillus sp. CLL-7-23]|uniref:Uncharacterized protein n=1 Tax=Bacillus changyiensis TaxID=3004103 RepID=A0ABT4X0D5_9BACI|nr:hypothetical protein [Bacillus changyiensis]MDA7025742.1 hypothetical protein [Bacillus changyiensis]